MGQQHDHDATTPVEQARAEAIRVAGFDPGDLAFMDDDEARAAYVDARAALLWSEVDLHELDELAARKVAAWEVLDAVYEEEQHSAAHTSPSARAMAQILREARIARGLTVDDIADRSGVSREVCTAIENVAYIATVAELSALAPVVGLTVGEVLDAGQEAGNRAESHLQPVVDEAPSDSSPR